MWKCRFQGGAGGTACHHTMANDKDTSNEVFEPLVQHTQPCTGSLDRYRTASATETRNTRLRRSAEVGALSDSPDLSTVWREGAVRGLGLLFGWIRMPKCNVDTCQDSKFRPPFSGPCSCLLVFFACASAVNEKMWAEADRSHNPISPSNLHLKRHACCGLCRARSENEKATLASLAMEFWSK
ncbi:hypothetical protein BD289DRAFT_63541 [Coniella lustricola]|uniref:Uncharacterized protein n=1 Tax=Coniella lustricola TaxID=2025994 RepID=A0A2T3A0A3_9PEZI|nr:hypothetical protein BD289DRAFT_63541 [Coniella lustricola]